MKRTKINQKEAGLGPFLQKTKAKAIKTEVATTAAKAATIIKATSKIPTTVATTAKTI